MSNDLLLKRLRKNKNRYKTKLILRNCFLSELEVESQSCIYIQAIPLITGRFEKEFFRITIYFGA